MSETRVFMKSISVLGSQWQKLRRPRAWQQHLSGIWNGFFSPQHNVAQVLLIRTLMPSGSPVLRTLFNPSWLPKGLWGSDFPIQIGKLSFQRKNFRWTHSICIKGARSWNELGLSNVILFMWFCCKSIIVRKILRCLLLCNTKFVRS